MAKLNIRTKVTGPGEITVNLIREDYSGISNIFRYVFEVFLAITSSIFGSIISLETPTNLHWIFLGVTGIATIGFFILAVCYHKKACQTGNDPCSQ